MSDLFESNIIHRFCWGCKQDVCKMLSLGSCWMVFDFSHNVAGKIDVASWPVYHGFLFFFSLATIRFPLWFGLLPRTSYGRQSHNLRWKNSQTKRSSPRGFLLSHHQQWISLINQGRTLQRVNFYFQKKYKRNVSGGKYFFAWYFSLLRSIFLSVMSRCDVRLKIHKYHGGEKSMQIRTLHVQ